MKIRWPLGSVLLIFALPRCSSASRPARSSGPTSSSRSRWPPATASSIPRPPPCRRSATSSSHAGRDPGDVPPLPGARIAPGGPPRVIRAVPCSPTPARRSTIWRWRPGPAWPAPAISRSTRCSVAWALATMPLLWLLGRRLGGPREALIACILFALAPASLYYSVEARMYSLLWFEVRAYRVAHAPAARSGRRGGARLLGARRAPPGLLTHYFYAFVWAACVLWLVLRPGRCSRGSRWSPRWPTLLSSRPWYRLVPESLARWRVTGHWLDGRPPLGHSGARTGSAGLEPSFRPRRLGRR